jgi:hypothetical protein
MHGPLNVKFGSCLAVITLRVHYKCLSVSIVKGSKLCVS